MIRLCPHLSHKTLDAPKRPISALTWVNSMLSPLPGGLFISTDGSQTQYGGWALPQGVAPALIQVSLGREDASICYHGLKNPVWCSHFTLDPVIEVKGKTADRSKTAGRSRVSQRGTDAHLRPGT